MKKVKGLITMLIVLIMLVLGPQNEVQANVCPTEDVCNIKTEGVACPTNPGTCYQCAFSIPSDASYVGLKFVSRERDEQDATDTFQFGDSDPHHTTVEGESTTNDEVPKTGGRSGDLYTQFDNKYDIDVEVTSCM